MFKIILRQVKVLIGFPVNAVRTWFWLTIHRIKGRKIHRSVEIIGRRRAVKRISIGHKIFLGREVSIYIGHESEAKLVFGNNVYIGRNTNIAAYHEIVIADDVMVAPYCHINSANHKFDRRDIPISKQGLSAMPIRIEKGAWIGTHAVVLPGVTIGEGAVIAAGSVVNRSVPPYEIWGGVPARYLKTRPL